VNLRRVAWPALAALGICMQAAAAPPTPAELTKLCADAEDQAHCGRLVEATQLKRLGRIVERNGDELRITLSPGGVTVFRDAVNIIGARTYAVWDYIADLDTVVLFATNGDRTEFWLVQRRGGAETRMPSEPAISPDRKRFATADFCPELCDNEVAIWRIGPEGARKESAWSPADRWTDASVAWKNADTIGVEYEPASGTELRTLERRLNDPSWRRIP